jgi:hypothetical protein
MVYSFYLLFGMHFMTNLKCGVFCKTLEITTHPSYWRENFPKHSFWSCSYPFSSSFTCRVKSKCLAFKNFYNLSSNSFLPFAYIYHAQIFLTFSFFIWGDSMCPSRPNTNVTFARKPLRILPARINQTVLCFFQH